MGLGLRVDTDSPFRCRLQLRRSDSLFGSVIQGSDLGYGREFSGKGLGIRTWGVGVSKRYGSFPK